MIIMTSESAYEPMTIEKFFFFFLISYKIKKYLLHNFLNIPQSLPFQTPQGTPEVVEKGHIIW